jgi:hypothetical protein
MEEAVPGADHGLESGLLLAPGVAALRLVQRLFHRENVACA